MEVQNETEQSHRVVELSIVNRGFSRHGVSPLTPPGTFHLSPALHADLSAVTEHPWETLQWWESPWQASVGIGLLIRQPFLRLHRSDMDQQELLIPTRMLYPYALRSTDGDRIERAASTVAASVRQAREMYTAAQAAGVTDLGRPLLYFYGALALARAATAAMFGADALEGAHGLGTDSAPTASSDRPEWRTLIQWRGEGQFPMLYRTARWDELYSCCFRDSRWQGRRDLDQPLRFHILECIRALQYPWGTLPPTGLAAPGTASFYARMRPHQMLPYHDPEHMYMTSETPLNMPLVQVPRVVVQYMLLYYFSILARYHPVEWQQLLAADRDPEGYVFRAAMERVAHDYVCEIVRLLPNTLPPWSYAPEQWTAERPRFDDGWYRPPSEVVGGPPVAHVNMYRLEEWDGAPQDTCAKATRLRLP